MKVVILDTNIYIKLFLKSKLIERLVEKINLEHDRFQLACSDAMFNEIKAKLYSQKLKSLIGKYDIKLVNDFLNFIRDTHILISPVKTLDIKENLLTDSDDIFLLELVEQENIDYIITHDKALLRLKSYNSCKIITPQEFLEIF
jgi:putative PIN family toxin of toxin-antitoxin system